MSWFFSSNSNSNGGHCGHCKGGAGTCACAICPQKGGSRCLRQHCPHCKGHAGGCACKQGCAKPGYAQCRPVASSTATGGVDHCRHCRGLRGSCACEEGCQKPSSAQCVSTSVAELGGLLGRVSLEQQVGIQPQLSVNLINVCFAVDASGSMAGSSWTKARQGVNRCLGQLSDNDYCSVITFNDKVEVIDCDTKKKLDISKFQSMQPSGNTALYDAIAQAVAAALQIRQLVDAATPLPVVTYVIVLTDGEDTKSHLSLQETQVLLQQANKLRNLKIILAGINLGGVGKQAVLKLASVGDDDIRFIDLQSTSDIDNLFEHISLELKAVRQTRLVVS